MSLYGGFRPRTTRFGDSYVKWDGGLIIDQAIAAAIVTIDQVNLMMADEARANHPWEDETFQTYDNVFPHEDGSYGEDQGHAAHFDPAKNEVWGEWGVHDAVRVRADGTLYRQGTTTEDVAMFLEFGTVNMEQMEWIYPAWDSVIGITAPLYAHNFRAMADREVSFAETDTDPGFDPAAWATSYWGGADAVGVGFPGAGRTRLTRNGKEVPIIRYVRRSARRQRG